MKGYRSDQHKRFASENASSNVEKVSKSHLQAFCTLRRPLESISLPLL